MAEPGKRIDIAGFLALIKPADLGVALIYIGLFALFLSFSVQNLGAAGSVLIQSSGQEYRYGFDEDRNLDFAGAGWKYHRGNQQRRPGAVYPFGLPGSDLR
jgi:hypothetical protein